MKVGNPSEPVNPEPEVQSYAQGAEKGLKAIYDSAFCNKQELDMVQQVSPALIKILWEPMHFPALNTV